MHSSRSLIEDAMVEGEFFFFLNLFGLFFALGSINLGGFCMKHMEGIIQF